MFTSFSGTYLFDLLYMTIKINLQSSGFIIEIVNIVIRKDTWKKRNKFTLAV